MAKKLGWNTNFEIDDLVIDWEDDIYKSFPFLKLEENGLTMKKLDELTAPSDNSVRGLVKSKHHKLDGLSREKMSGLLGSLTHGWDRTSWPIPFIKVNGEKQIFDRRHTYYVLQELNNDCKNISQVQSAEYIRVKSELGGIINRFSDISILMMASMWGNVYGPNVDDTKFYQFKAVITKILRQEKEFLGLKKDKIFTKDIIRDLFKYMGGEDRYPDNNATVTRVINGSYADLNDDKKSEGTDEPCIMSNIEAFNGYIEESDEWLPNNKEDENAIYRNYVISNNAYHMTDIIRKLTLTICKEELKVKPGKDAKLTKVILYNEKQSDQSDEIRKSRKSFEKEFAKLFYTIRDSVLLPVENYLNKDVIPRKKLSDFNLEVYAMHQIEGEEEPIKLLGEY